MNYEIRHYDTPLRYGIPIDEAIFFVKEQFFVIMECFMCFCNFFAIMKHFLYNDGISFLIFHIAKSLPASQFE